MFAEWHMAPSAPAQFLSALPRLQRVTAQVLYARGLHDPAAAQALLDGTFAPARPGDLRGMGAAVDRIHAAIAAGESIAVYGDYDCDGVTSCALLATVLRALGAEPRVYIPDRFEEGYGLNAGALSRLADEGIRVVVTVDCGARAVAEAQYARARGIDLLITDHHELGEAIPEAHAFVNPLQPGCAYPYKTLAGVGLAFRLAQCLLREARRRGRVVELSERSLLDFVAIGTVADVVPLTGENRALVRGGLDEINRAPRPGVRALLSAAGVAIGLVDAGRIGFALAPRLNAAGRLGNARAAYELLVAEDDVRAGQLAAELTELNVQRQEITARTAADAEQTALEYGEGVPLLFAASEAYNAGVIGLAAARLAERHRRPAVVVTLQGDEARGSCRSVPGFHITAALDHCADLLVRHGGHAAAAGFSMERTRVQDLADRLRDYAADLQPPGGWRRTFSVDAELLPGELGWELQRELALLEPHGAAHARPMLLARGMHVVSVRAVGADGAHLQMRLRDAFGATWAAIGWRAGERVRECEVGVRIDVLFHPIADEYEGTARLQLEVQDFRMTDG